MTQNIRVRFFILFALVATSCGINAQAEIIDQSSPQGSISLRVDDETDQAQTFTVGISGQLTSVDLFIGKEAGTSTDLFFDVRTVSGSAPAESDSAPDVLGSAMLSAGTITADGWYNFDLSTDSINVNAGQVLALTLSTADTDGYRWLANDTNAYSDGESFVRFSSTWTPQPFSRDIDQSFRTIVAVPEPTGLVPLALLCLVVARRRSKRN